MTKRLFFSLVCLLALASLCVAADLPSYKASIASKIPGAKLSIDCVIDQPVEKATLEALAQKVYDENDGKNYKSVFIMWYLPHYKIGSGAWGTTNFTDGKMSVSILMLQG